MAWKRYLIEIGQGVDMHGEDGTNASLKAINDAMHHCCMCGIVEVLGLKATKDCIRVKADIYVPDPNQVDQEPLKEALSRYDTDLILHQGGADPEGLYHPEMGEGTHITVALAILTVYVNIL